MKLASHYNKASILITITVLLVGAVVYFIAINNIAQRQLDRDLSEEIEEILEYVNIHQQLPKAVDFDEDQTTFLKVGLKRIETRFFDTIYHNPKALNDKDGRAVESSFMLKGQNYKFAVVISKASTQYLVQIITMITLVLVVTLLLILFLTNRFLLNDLWKPFYRLLKYLKTFDVSETKLFEPGTNRVDEFMELDSAIMAMTIRVKDEFLTLKQFTENASHEMMTPLSVIVSKLDTLIQDTTLKSEQFEQINDIYSATNKLSRLNNSLLLLLKIENNLVENAEELDLESIINDKLKQFQELMTANNIMAQTNLTTKTVTASSQLIDILLNNLIGNAIRHNAQCGVVNIVLTDNGLTILNSGSEVSLNVNDVFKRFNKSSKSEGIGLGLALAQNICTLYNWRITYHFEDYLHAFEISF